MHTLRVVLHLLNMQFFMDRIDKRYSERDCGAEHVVLLSNRCLKLYNLIEHVGLIYRLLQRRETFNPSDLEQIERDARLFLKSITTANWVRWNATFVTLDKQKDQK